MSTLRNSKGIADIYLISLLVAVTIGLSGLSQYSLHLSKMANRVRVRAHLAQVNSTVEMLLRSPISYTCSGNGGFSNCALTTGSPASPFSGTLERIEQLMGPIPGETCSPGVSCGLYLANAPVMITPPGEDQPHVQLTIAYKGNLGAGTGQFSHLDIAVPLESIQNSSFTCDTYFDGFKPDGSINCKDMTFQRAPAGQYIKRINRENFSVEFGALPAIVNDCASGDLFMVNYSWEGESKYSITCGQRIDPFLIN